MVGTFKPYLLLKKIELFSLSGRRDAKTLVTSSRALALALAQQATSHLGRHSPPAGRHPPGQKPPRVDTPLGRHPPWADTLPGQTPPCAVHAGIRSTCGRYASYWNAILSTLVIHDASFFVAGHSSSSFNAVVSGYIAPSSTIHDSDLLAEIARVLTPGK